MYLLREVVRTWSRSALRAAQPKEFAPELLAVALFEGEHPQDLGEDAARVVSEGDFSGKAGETALLYGQEGLAPRLLLVGLGDRDHRKPREAAPRRGNSGPPRQDTQAARSGPLAADPARYGHPGGRAGRGGGGEARPVPLPDRHKTTADGHELEKFWLVADEEGLDDAREGADIGAKVAAGAVLARDLANEPSNVATPEYLAERARSIAEKYGMRCDVLDRAAIEAEGLTGLATVGRSASNEPRFIVLEHRKGGDEAPVVLVGKAVTFDSGGISIKPTAGMEDMKFDMSGGAAVLGAMEAVGALDLPLNVVALVPATENLPGGDAFKPGDVLEMHSGKTVEIVTTDAEGRLILADALSYARRYEPSAVIDCATLTGACVVALGAHASGLMGNDEDLIAEVQAAGEATGERAWPLPLFEEYTEQIKGDTADIKNSGGRGGGALTAGAFLKEFADFPWAHLDIAGTAYGKKGNAYTTKGATGVPTRLLVEFLIGRTR